MTTSLVSLQILACNFGTLLFLVKNLFCCLWCNKKNSCSLCKSTWLRRKPIVSCVGTIHNVVPRPRLQMVIVTKCVRTLLCSCGEGVGGKVKWEHRCFCFVLFCTFSKTGMVWLTCSRCNKNIAMKHLFVFLAWRAVGLGQGREDSKWSCSLGGWTETTGGSPSCERESTLNKSCLPQTGHKLNTNWKY